MEILLLTSRAGLQQGDVIIGVNDKAAKTTWDIMEAQNTGDDIQMTVRRGNSTLSLNCKL